MAASMVAIFLWFFVVTGENYEHRTTVPIEIIKDNPNFVVTSEPPTKAGVLLKGSGKYLFSFILFREGRIRINVDWQDGKQTVYLSDKDISFSGNAKKLSSGRLLWPDSISITVEELISASKPVQNNVMLKPQAGYTIVGDIIVEPDSVLLIGAKSFVNAVDTIYTKSVVEKDLRYPFNKEYPLISPDCPFVTLQNPQVTIAADVQKLLEKTISNVPVIVRYLPHNIHALVIPAQLSLKVHGGVDVVGPISAKDIYAYIEYRRDFDEQNDYKVEIEPIPNIRYRDITPERFKIRLQRLTENQ